MSEDSQLTQYPESTDGSLHVTTSWSTGQSGSHARRKGRQDGKQMDAPLNLQRCSQRIWLHITCHDLDFWFSFCLQALLEERQDVCTAPSQASGIHCCQESRSNFVHWLLLVTAGLQQCWHVSVQRELASDTCGSEECLEFLNALRRSLLLSNLCDAIDGRHVV